MKKYLLIFIIISFITLYSGCNKSKTQNEKILNSAIEKITLSEEVKCDIELPTIIDEDVHITWSSSLPNVISNDGKVSLQNESTEVILTATFTYNKYKKEVNYRIRVLSKEEVYRPIIEGELTKLIIPTTIKNKDILPSKCGLIDILWSSEDLEIIDNVVFIDDDVDYQNGVEIKGIFSYQGFEIVDLIHMDVINAHLEITNVIEKFENSFKYQDKIEGLLPEIDGIEINWQFEPEGLVNEDGTFNRKDEIQNVTLNVIFKKANTNSSITKTYNIEIGAYTDEDYVKMAMDEVVLPEKVKEDLNLVNQVNGVKVTWKSKTISYVNDKGNITRGEKDRKCQIEATFTLNDCIMTKVFDFVILKYTDIEFINLIINELELPQQTNIDLVLPIYFDYEVSALWLSSDEGVISNDGKVTIPDHDTEIVLTATFKRGDESVEKEYKVIVQGQIDPSSNKPHQVIMRSQNFNSQNFDGVTIKDGLLQLDSTRTEGIYESDVINTISFNGLVASWASTSSEVCTAEIELKVKVGTTWSEYITYYPWGFGLENKCYDQNNGIIKLNEDEVSVLNSKLGSAIIFKVILRRNSVMVESPKLSLVSFALKCASYQYPVNISNLPKEKVYDVPRLYQGAVPVIGGSICSPTTSTMLLKYKGENFSQFDQYEHRHIANKFKEYNTGIFGNWVYNTVGISSFGYNSYVARMYSIEELIWHLANVGPVGLSVKGQMTSSEKNYYTNGHLIVGIGYKYVGETLYIVCNDPNVPNVYCEYNVSVIKNTWRNIAYIVE